MMPEPPTWCVLLIALQAAGCSSRDSNKTPDPPQTIVLATIASQRISKADFVRRLDSLAPELRARYVATPKLLAQVLTQMVDERLAVIDARKRGTPMGSKLRRGTIQQLRRQLEGRVYKQLRSYRPTAEQERTFYEKSRDRFIVPQQLLARHILVSTRALAEKVASEVKAVDDQHGHREGGTNFTELVEKYSIDQATKTRGGGLGAFSGPTPLVDEAVFKATLKLTKHFEVSPPVKSPKGWHVIQLIQRQKRQELTLQQARPTIQLLLRQQRGATLVEAELASLRAKYGVRLYLDRIGKLPPPPTVATRGS